MEPVSLFLGASTALAAGMLGHLHLTRAAAAKERRAMAECEQRLVKVHHSLEATAKNIHEARGYVANRADAAFAEAKINEAIAELSTFRERRKGRTQLVARG